MVPEELDIIFQDDYLVAVNKPSGLLVHRSFLDKHETRFAMQTVRDQIGQHVFPVHRLDRPTSGVLLFALNSNIARQMSELFASSTIYKRYLAVTRGFAPGSVTVDKPLKYQHDKIADKFSNDDKEPQQATTVFRCLNTASFDHAVGKYPSVRYSLVECVPTTGRKHQIRRHLNHINHPILNDVNHGDNTQNHFFATHFGISRLLLMAQTMSFDHPVTGETLQLQADLGGEMLELFEKMGWENNEDAYRLLPE